MHVSELDLDAGYLNLSECLRFVCGTAFPPLPSPERRSSDTRALLLALTTATKSTATPLFFTLAA